MTFSQFATLVRKYTKSNATTFTDADILVYANIFKDDIAAQVAKDVGEDYFGLRFKRDLLDDIREYDLPAEMLARIKYLEAKLDGNVWQVLRETDLTAYNRATDEDTIEADFSSRSPEFDIWDNSIFILSSSPIVAVTNGLKLWCIIYPADFSDLSSDDDMSTPPDDTSHGFPREVHELLARRVSIAYKSSKDRPVPLSEKEKLYEVDLAIAIKTMKDENLDRSVVPASPYNDGSQY
jgi:hypothetical protein